MTKKTTPNTKTFLKFAMDLTEQAAGIIAQYNKRRRKLQITHKGSEGIASEADEKIERFLIKLIRKKYPQHTILAEESFHRNEEGKFETILKDDYVWLIDPIDGTNNFVNGLPFYVISIALAYKGKPIVGVVYNPVLEEWYFATKGGGAFTKKNGSRKVSLKSPANYKKVHECVFSATTLPKKENKAKDQIKRLNENTKNALAKRRFGSAALELCYVSNGFLDGYWGKRLKPWDVAAAGLICKEAGARVTDIYGRPFDLKYDTILAAFNPLYKKILP